MLADGGTQAIYIHESIHPTLLAMGLQRCRKSLCERNNKPPLPDNCTKSAGLFFFAGLYLQRQSLGCNGARRLESSDHWQCPGHASNGDFRFYQSITGILVVTEYAAPCQCSHGFTPRKKATVEHLLSCYFSFCLLLVRRKNCLLINCLNNMNCRKPLTAVTVTVTCQIRKAA